MTAATVTRHPRLDAASDEDLLARVAGGDRDALGELYRRHRGVVRGYVLTRIARGDDADDVVQETFLRAAKQAGQFRAGDGHRVPPWLCWQAGAQLREYGQRDRHPYLAAARAAREQARRPVTETAEQREATPLSEPVRAALGRLTPGERRAIQLRYIDGLNPEQAAEIAGVRKRSLHRRVADGRRKLAAELADLAPPARSPLQDMPRREAITRALAATRDDVPAAAQWLRKQGVHASEANLYRYRQMLQAGEPLPRRAGQAAAHRCGRPAPPTPHLSTSPRWPVRWSGPARPGSTTAPGSVACPPGEKSWTPSASPKAQRCERCARSKRSRTHGMSPPPQRMSRPLPPRQQREPTAQGSSTTGRGRPRRMRLLSVTASPVRICTTSAAYARRTRRSARSPIPALGTPYGARVDPRRRPRRRLPTQTWAEQRPLTPTRQPGPAPDPATTLGTRSPSGHAAATPPPTRAPTQPTVQIVHRARTCRSATPEPQSPCWPRTEPSRRSAARRPSTTTTTRWRAGTPRTTAPAPMPVPMLKGCACNERPHQSSSPARSGGGLPGRDVGGRAGPRPGSAAPRRHRARRPGPPRRAAGGAGHPPGRGHHRGRVDRTRR